MTKYIIILFILLVGMSSCRHKDSNVTPRRYAYPRIEAYDSTYRRLTVGPVSIEVNAAAATSSPKDGWLDIYYPRYGATVYLSATHTDDLPRAIANRRQRISLNLGGAKRRLRLRGGRERRCRCNARADTGRVAQRANHQWLGKYQRHYNPGRLD